MYVIDYVFINDILKINIENGRAFRGCEIDSDHRLLEKYRPTSHSKHSHYIKDKTIHIEVP